MISARSVFFTRPTYVSIALSFYRTRAPSYAPAASQGSLNTQRFLITPCAQVVVDLDGEKDLEKKVDLTIFERPTNQVKKAAAVAQKLGQLQRFIQL
jgi:hypothetical protein